MMPSLEVVMLPSLEVVMLPSLEVVMLPSLEVVMFPANVVEAIATASSEAQKSDWKRFIVFSYLKRVFSWGWSGLPWGHCSGKLPVLAQPFK